MTPFVHISRFEVRHYECDALGWLRPPAILGYMQEAGFGASAAVGWSAARYAEAGFHWFAYETQLELLQPLRYGDFIEIKTWIADFRRVRSLRQYELYRDGQMIGHGGTDWVFINAKTLYPATIPQDIVDAYAQNVPDLVAPKREPFPTFPAAPPQVFSLTRHVEGRDIDPAGHVNNAVYLQYALEAERQALKAQGWDAEQFNTANAMLTTRRLQIEYKGAAKLDDEVTISTWVADVDAHGGMRYTTISRGDKVLTRLQSAWGWSDAETGEARPLAPEFSAALI